MPEKEEIHQSRGEEIANSISHGLGALAAMAGAPFLIVAATKTGSPWNIVGASIFLWSMFFLYMASTLYHALPPSKAKKVFRIFDHGSIFLLIAGTYTPFTLGILRGPWGWTLFGVIWGLAIAGIALKSVNALWHPALSNTLYLLMGWLIMIAAKSFWQNAPHASLWWLLGGGAAYSIGVYFYTVQRWRYAHFIWHIFVLTGTVCHYFSVLAAVR